MKFEINTILLQTVCNKAVKAVSTKDIIPSLKNFLIDAAEQNIHIIAGDSAVYIEKDIACNSIKEAGKVCVDAKDFTKLMNKIDADNVILETDDNKLVIKAGKSKFKLKTIDPEEYVYPENLVLDADGLQVILPEFKKALKLGAITVSKNATEVYFTAYKIGKCVFTTNRNNLMIYEMPLCGDDLLLSPDTVGLIHDLDGDTATFGYTTDFIEIRTDGTRIIGNLICGIDNFPPDSILEGFSYENIAKVTKRDLTPVLERAMIFVDSLGAIELKFTKDSILKTQLVGATDVDTYEEIGYNGSIEATINVNVGMLSNICSALDTDVIEFHLDSPESPLLVKSGNYTALMASMSVD
jgi:DNA polymerase III sliding clamp (beta) subunit (PCNA family)